MCGPDGWKDRVKVCLPLLALFNRTLFPENETQLQGNYCSFAHALLERIDVRNAVSSRADCRPHDGGPYSINCTYHRWHSNDIK